jgi:GTP-binding protein
LSRGLKPIVVINKVDRPSSRVEEVESEIFDLFCNLDASDDQLEYPTVYAAAKEGWAVTDLESKREGVTDLLNVINEFVPSPDVNVEDDFTMLIT